MSLPRNTYGLNPVQLAALPLEEARRRVRNARQRAYRARPQTDEQKRLAQERKLERQNAASEARERAFRELAADAAKAACARELDVIITRILCIQGSRTVDEHLAMERIKRQQAHM